MTTIFTTSPNTVQPDCLVRNELVYVTIGSITIPSGGTAAVNWITETHVYNNEGASVFSYTSNLQDYNSGTPSFYLPVIGDYTYTTTYHDTGKVGGEFITENGTFKVCDCIKIEEISCNQYKYSNASTTLAIQVYYHDPLGVIADSIPVTILPQDAAIISFPTVTSSGKKYVGVFAIITMYTFNSVLTTEYRLASSYCIIEDCIATYISNMLCGDVDMCDPCSETADLNRMLMLSYSYFMQANKEYSLNTFYTALTETKLSEIEALSGVMDKLLQLCMRKSCIDETLMSYPKYGIYPYSEYDDSFISKPCSTCR